MIKTIIYSCVFFDEKYINLINLLLKSYKLFGNSSDDVDYLIICNPNFQKKIQAIFDNLNISGKIWCIDLKTKFEAGYSRVKIFDYPDINLYNKILYLDCDILVTNSIYKILDFQLENKLYALKESYHRHHHHQLFTDEEYELLDKNSAFSSGTLLFNNHKVIKDLFSQILLHIHNHIASMLPIPDCLDQPFIVYHAVKNNLYNNQKLINIVINNPNNFNNETISHFPGGPGEYKSKILKMSNFMKNVMFNLKNESKQKYIIQVGAHIGNTSNDKLFNNIDQNIIYILIEPVPYLYKQLVENYKNKANVILLNIAISNKTEPLTLYIPSEKNNFSKLPFWASQLASVNKDHLNIHIPELIVEQISVECKTLNDIIKEYKIENLEAIYTDTEGHDYEILMDLDLDLLSALPKTIFFEHKHLDGTNSFNLNERPKYFKLLEKFKSVGYYINNQDWEDCELKLKDHNSIINKKYVWEKSTIEFLANGKMKAFGSGKYRFINKYLIKCDFGGREHLLKFDEDYSRFISVRKDDFEVVVGNHL
tara:strand:- start:2028 stop:3641 length:1614 start_codon:yes stop_codon:yes gene_type:complete